MDATPTPEMPTPAAPGTTPCPVGEVMRRVQGQLRSGRAPSYEALLAYGAPTGGTTLR